jgi:hypothetical protein
MDIYDGADWTEMDIDDLKAAIEAGRSIEEAAQFLCRADSVENVARKSVELGLKPKKGAVMKDHDSDGVAKTEVDHFMKCSGCAQ